MIQAFWIPSGSMILTLEVSDRVLVLKFWYAMPKVEPKRGQIAVFKYPVDPRRISSSGLSDFRRQSRDQNGRYM